jgi:copper homeostasis protein CutC
MENPMPLPVPTPNFERDIGALQATVSMLASAMKEQAALHERQMQNQQEQYIRIISDFKEMVTQANKQIAELKDEIGHMKSLIDQAKGGWKILIGVGAISAAIGGFLTKFFAAVWNLPR